MCLYVEYVHALCKKIDKHVPSQTLQCIHNEDLEDIPVVTTNCPCLKNGSPGNIASWKSSSVWIERYY